MTKKNLAVTVGKTVKSSRPTVRSTPKTVKRAPVSGLLRAMELSSSIGPMTLTANGAITPANTGNAVLDFFSKFSGLRGKSESEIVAAFVPAFLSDESLALRALFYARDVRGGQGERNVFRTLIRWLATNHTNALRRNLLLIPYFGRWDDLFVLFGTPLQNDMMTIVNNQLDADLHTEDESISLLAKWMPSENASNSEGIKQARAFAAFFGISPKIYRKMLSQLRARINVLETKMCGGNWSAIEFDKIPSRAGMVYRKAFQRHEPIRYAQFLANVKRGTAKINASTLYPYDIVRKMLLFNESNDTLEALWKALPDYIGDKKGNRLVVADVSGSMSSGLTPDLRPLDVCIGLAIYLAERNVGLFKDYFITFSGSSELQKLRGNTLSEKIRNLNSAEWGMNTNIQAVFDNVLDKAIENRIPKSHMPTEIFIISDMQFDSAVDNRHSNLDVIRQKYANSGYKMPTLVFWHVSGHGNGAPAKSNDKNIVLVSGCSPSIVSSLLSGKNTTPLDFMLKVLNGERYQVVK